MHVENQDFITLLHMVYLKFMGFHVEFLILKGRDSKKTGFEM